jgi:adenylate kinase family enzyme
MSRSSCANSRALFERTASFSSPHHPSCDAAGKAFLPLTRADVCLRKMRLLISGGPGSGCTSTAKAIGERLGVPVFDSDSYFHKPTDPPFQEQYTLEERRSLLGAALSAESNWVVSGSVATWGLGPLNPTHGVFLRIPREVRLNRLLHRQRNQFGSRIEAGGDMEEEHRLFMEWASGYEERTGPGRNLDTDRTFVRTHCHRFLEFMEDEAMEEIVSKILGFLAGTSPGAALSSHS